MIQKITPKKFVSDKDERLVAPNEMILAENVTISERADGSASILKTMKGTSEIIKKTGEIDAPDTWKVVGSCSDNQRGRVYFFLYDTADSTDHRIMMFEKSTNKWRTVLKNAYLKFDEQYPVKADVINKAFRQDGEIQSVIYFTDNNNPPRKINIDRAVDGDYVYVPGTASNPIVSTNIDLDYAILTMRACPSKEVTFSFGNDNDLPANNFKNEVFQLATQFLYKDGEESALSAYSKIAVPPSVVDQGVSELVFNGPNDGNVCIMNMPWNQGSDSEKYVDVSKIRLLFRIGNTGSFSIADEFDPRENLTRRIGNNVSKTIYDADTSVYRFYSDGYYSRIADSVSGKLYDNVPQKAQGQALAESRLLYSNYTEGYENYDIASSVQLTVDYGSEEELGGSYLLDADYVVKYPSTDFYSLASEVTAAKGNGEIVIDLLDSSGFDWDPDAADTSATVVPEDTLTTINFAFDPEGSYYNTTTPGPMATLNGATFTEGNGGTFDLEFGVDNLRKIEIPAPTSDSPNPKFEIRYTTSSGDTVEDIRDGLKAFVDSANPTTRKTFTQTSVKAKVVNVTGDTSVISDGDEVTFTQVVWEAEVSIGNTLDGTSDSDSFIIRPWIRRVSSFQPTFTPGLNGFPDGTELDTIEVDGATAIDLDTPAVSSPIYQVKDIDQTPIDDYITDIGGSSITTTFLSSFKHGSSHEFGIVYFDKWGRSGFVNKIGSTYIKHPSERTSGEEGSATVSVDISDALDGTNGDGLPSWAERYQIVYGGSQYSNVFSYTTGGSYFAKDSTGTKIADDRRVFVSLNSLSQFQDQTGSPRDYSFTKGDICRVISYSDAGTKTYATSNEYGGGIVEFEVVGVETFDDTSYDGISGNPIIGNDTTNTEEYQGEFLILKAPRIDGGLQIAAAADGVEDDQLKYDGFDWQSISTSAYPSGTGSGSNFWGQETVIEILTPKKSSDTPIYYEIGEQILLEDPGAGAYGYHGPDIKLKDGDVQIRSVSCRGPKYSSPNWNKADLDEWKDKVIALECETPGEFITEKSWSKGRAHATFERAATINRYNSITYSQPYADDTNVLALSSFVPSQANFFDLPSEHGPCTYIGLSSDNLMAMQENKVSRLGLNKGVLETGTQSGVVTISTKLINNLVSYAGDFGTKNPESVLIRDGVVYFVDSERRAIVRISNKGLEVISDKDVKSKISNEIQAWENNTGLTIVSGYDAEDDIYYATLTPRNSFNGYTIGYDEKGGFWQGNYTFYADRYASLKDSFYGLKAGNDSIMHEFSDLSISNRFFDSSASPVASKVRVVSNANPSMVKKYQAISVESKVQWSAKLFDSDGRESKEVSFSEREDAFYGMVEGIKTYISADTNSKRKTNDVRYLPLGTVSSATNSGDQGYGNDRTTIVLENNLRGMHLPINYDLYYVDSGDKIIPATSNLAEYGYAPRLVSVDRTTSTVVFEPAFDLTPSDNAPNAPTAGMKLFLSHSLDGLTSEGIRDHYSVIELSLTPDDTAGLDIDGEELYAINAYFKNSPLNHAIG